MCNLFEIQRRWGVTYHDGGVRHASVLTQPDTVSGNHVVNGVVILQVRGTPEVTVTALRGDWAAPWGRELALQ